MARWSRYSSEELERRRRESIDAMRERDRARFDAWYQEQMDADYWRLGQRCSGCDHWESEGGGVGLCSVAPPVSGQQILKSLGIKWSTYTPAPGRPYTRAEYWCGKFQDEFDWSSLDPDYLHKIGAMKDGALLPLPQRGNQPGSAG